MALVKPTLKAAMLALMTEMRTKTEVSDDYYAGKFADMIDAYIKSATVTVEPGIAVTTSAGTGATSAPGTGALS